MLNPVSSSSQWQPSEIDNSPIHPAKEDLNAAEAEVASLYYQSSLAPANIPTQAVAQEKAIQEKEKKELERSFLNRAKDWLWEILGWGQKQPAADVQFNEVELSNEAALPGPYSYQAEVPNLLAPERKDKQQLSQAIIDLTRELVHMQKNMVEFEEEIRKSSSNKLDKFIFIQLFNSATKQKKLKETLSLITHQELLNLHHKNKELQKQNFNIVDAIYEENKIRGILKWVNVGLTGVAIGGMAIGFAVSGPFVILTGIPLSLSLIGKGSVTLTDGILKYKSDRKTGDLLIIKQETKENNSNINEKLEMTQAYSNEISALIKMIKHHLDNQAKAERASFGRT